MGELIEKMRADLQVGGFSATTTTIFVLLVQQFAQFHGRSPVDLGQQDVSAFLACLAEKSASRATLRHARVALCFLFEVTLGRGAEVAFLRQKQSMSTEGASHG